MVRIPSAFAIAVEIREGEAGRRWLEQAPSVIADACGRWGCTIDGEVEHGQVALVVPVQHTSGPAVIKVSFPHPGHAGEAAALHLFEGHGAVRLIDADPDKFVLLMERGGPATLAHHLGAGFDMSVDEAIELAGDLARRLAVPANPHTVSLSSTTTGWAAQLDDQLAAVPDALPAVVIDQARRTIEHLAGDTVTTMIHGDLHLGNILQARREPWLAIDPKGWSGTPAWDAFTVIAGRSEDLHQKGDIRRQVVGRVHRFAKSAGVDAELALACCQARAVSSYLYQHLVAGNWFDLRLLRVLAQDAD